MEEVFSSNSEVIIQKKLSVDFQNNLTLDTPNDFNFYFDIEKIVDWISVNDYKKVNNCEHCLLCFGLIKWFIFLDCLTISRRAIRLFS